MRPFNILIADDDREHLEMLALMCRAAGYQVITAVDARTALALALERTPDLLLLDVHLGDADGYGIQSELQKLDNLADTPVIYLTGDQSAWVDWMSVALRASGVFHKPFKMEELLSAMRQVLAGRSVATVASPIERYHAALAPLSPDESAI